MPSFDPTQRRILGVLIEKRLTTPDHYPLTPKAILAGCNQKNNRNPAMDLADWELEGTLTALIIDEWVREVRRAGGRTMRYEERLSTRLGLDERQAAVLAELMLRGPSTQGEIRSRAARMTELGPLEQVHALLDELRNPPFALVAEAARAPGTRETRWYDLLASEELCAEPAPGTPCDSAEPEEPEEPVEKDSKALARIAVLESTVKELRRQMQHLAAEIGIELESESR